MQDCLGAGPLFMLKERGHIYRLVRMVHPIEDFESLHLDVPGCVWCRQTVAGL
ncbi:hypothetical protein [cf. Phormidesmis sp. LEGE 11477]|uniref:hypothetical protein n=1 Tax=cf. Phormidesmis sp. LEGE 11477 TaxID=1828680 RepID=UPI0018819461|nr:hypothetical protein [cf. Phormidesmis sp. LEGE 11477]MBE9062347.1 hypothetical protein [cf. Phormidesmis sp. LEGE 11477]